MNHLQGASAKTDAWHFRVSSGNNYLITLSDAAGAQKFSIRDSAGVEQFSVDSDGTVVITTLTPTTLNLPTSASPSQTAEGRIVWDSDDDILTVGDGTGRQTFYPGGRLKLLANVATPTSTTSTSAVDLVTISTDVSGAALSIPATAWVRIMFNFRKQALAANRVAYGLKINSTTVYECVVGTTALASTSGTNQAEDGVCIIDIAPRSANYLNGLDRRFTTRVSATGAWVESGSVTSGGGTAAIPNAAITSIAIRAINDTASNAAEVSSVQIWQMGA